MERKRKTKLPCKSCYLNADFCICAKISKLSLKTRVDLVVHHRELKRTTNTGRLIESLLVNQSLWVRGLKDNELDHSKVLDSRYKAVILYPAKDALVLTSDLAKELALQKPIQVIVPDGNWRQASKVHYRVKDFEHIQRVRLPEDLADRENLVRKESKVDGMSTLEAIGHVLGFFEGAEVRDQILEIYRLKKEATLRSRGQI